MRNFKAWLASSHPGDSFHNTLILSGIDLIIPLEIDLELDPEPDDELRLKSADGLYEAHLQASDPDVTRDGDNPLLLYRFRDVTPGIYRVEHLVGDTWYQILGELHVSRKGAFINGQSFEEPPDGSPLGTPVYEPDTDDELQPDMDVQCQE